MEGPSPKTCAACGKQIAPTEMYYRFNLVLQAEQDVLDVSGGSPEKELAAILVELATGPEDPREWEEQVHTERSGAICSACRSVVMRTLARPPESSGPH